MTNGAVNDDGKLITKLAELAGLSLWFDVMYGVQLDIEVKVINPPNKETLLK